MKKEQSIVGEDSQIGDKVLMKNCSIGNHCRIGERSILARVRGKEAPPVGATVGVRWQASAAHIFDAASGHRVTIEPGATARPRLHTVSH